MVIIMDNSKFIKYLQQLSTNRFALNVLSGHEYQDFLHTLLAHFHQQKANQYYLIGTDGCHLCDDVMTLCQRIGLNVTALELSDANDVLIDTLGLMIPILVTPTALLCYPFGVMDLMALPVMTDNMT